LIFDTKKKEKERKEEKKRKEKKRKEYQLLKGKLIHHLIGFEPYIVK